MPKEKRSRARRHARAAEEKDDVTEMSAEKQLLIKPGGLDFSFSAPPSGSAMDTKDDSAAVSARPSAAPRLEYAHSPDENKTAAKKKPVVSKSQSGSIKGKKLKRHEKRQKFLNSNRSCLAARMVLMITGSCAVVQCRIDVAGRKGQVRTEFVDESEQLD